MALKKCKECGKDVSTKADKCPHCGASQRIGCGTALLICSGVFVFLVVIASMGEKPQRNPEQDRANSRQKACTEPWGAIRFAQAAVTATLKAPSTAKFPEGGFLQPDKDTKAIPSKDCTWTIISYVDSQNSFGAMIRSKWGAKIKLRDLNQFNDPQWELLDIGID